MLLLAPYGRSAATKINKINTFFNEKDKQTNGKKSELYVDRVTLDSFKD